MNMKLITLSFVTVTLTACTTTPPATVGETAKIASRDVERGQGSCALYGWTTDEKRSFVFYADAETARYDTARGPVDLTAETEFPSLLYSDPDGGRVELRLGEGEAMMDGTRFPSARIITQTDEGWDRLRPVALVQNCQAK